MASVRSLEGKTVEELVEIVREQDLVIETVTGQIAEDFVKWYKVTGPRAEDSSLTLSKKASLTLSPIHTEVTIRYPLPRGWPQEIRDRVMKLMLLDLDDKLREALFGAKAEKKRKSKIESRIERAR